jgi:hypothetical protein
MELLIGPAFALVGLAMQGTRKGQLFCLACLMVTCALALAAALNR